MFITAILNNLQTFIAFLILFFLIQYCWKKRKVLCNDTENRITTDITEVVPNINYKMFKIVQVFNLIIRIF